MPLCQNARSLIFTNLEQCALGKRPPAVVIGKLTDVQIADINAQRVEDDLATMAPEVVFIGLHLYQSRSRDGYQVEDMLDQIESAMGPDSRVIDTQYMTAIENPNFRDDRYGNRVNDRAVFECTKRFPRPELYSVSPKGDDIKPPGITEAVRLTDDLRAFERLISG